MTTLASRAARTKTVDSRRRLVVIGNGMAGARAVEEILARGGGGAVQDHHVRRRALRQLQPDHAQPRPLRRGGHRQHLPQLAGLVPGKRHHPARGRPGGQDRPLRQAGVFRRRPGHPVRRPGHRHRQPLAPAADGRHVHAGRAAAARDLRLPHHRRHPQHGVLRPAGPPPPRRGDRRRTAGAGSRAGAAKPRHRRRRRPLRRPPHERADGARRRRGPAPQRGGPRHQGPHGQPDHGRSWARTRCGASGCGTSRTSSATWWWWPPASAPTWRWRSPAACRWSGPSWWTTTCACPDEDEIYAVGECVQHRGEVYGLVAPLWEQAAVLADHVTGANPKSVYLGIPDRHQTEGGRRRRRIHGAAGPGTGHRRARGVLGAQPRRLQVDRDPGRQDRGRHAARGQPQGGVPDAGIRPRPAAAGGTRLAAVRRRRAGRGGRGRGTRRRRPGLQLQRRQQADARGHGEGRLHHAGRRHGRHAGGQGLRLLQAAGPPGGGVGRRRRRGGGPRGGLLRSRRAAGEGGR